jgi:hypothetical protein
VEMAYLCEKLGYRIIEIPIHFADRRIGQSKLDMPVKLESAWRTWQIRWRYRGPMRGSTPQVPSVDRTPVGIDEELASAVVRPRSSVTDH